MGTWDPDISLLWLVEFFEKQNCHELCAQFSGADPGTQVHQAVKVLSVRNEI
jgi:hypothetical protein